eukprot:m.263126 g.263126  ORF g.263126 m.263126 type:complete len:1329 (-) comp26372_c0_seq1:103-4089(-)
MDSPRLEGNTRTPSPARSQHPPSKVASATRLHGIYNVYGSTWRRDTQPRKSLYEVLGTFERLYQGSTIGQRLAVHVNGQPRDGETLVARGLADLLSQCTARFGMGFAARRAFDKNGRELTTDTDVLHLERNADVYVSSGEPFRDPLREVQRRLLRVESAARRSKARVAESPPATSRSDRSDRSDRSVRMSTLLAQAKPRVLVFRNGDGRHGAEVVQAPTLEGLFDDSASRLRLPAKPKLLFTALGQELQTVPSTLCNPALTWLLGRVIGPVWVTNGTPMSFNGPRRFIVELRTRLVQRGKLVDARLGDLAEVSEYEDLPLTRLDHMQDIDKMAPFQLRAHKAQLVETLDYLTQLSAEVEEAAVDASDEPRIPVISKASRLLRTAPLRVIVCCNGEADAGVERAILFDRFQPRSGDVTLFDVLLALCADVLGIGTRAKRLFLVDGREIVDKNLLNLVTDGLLQRNTRVWVSAGEAFIPLQPAVLDAASDPYDNSNGQHAGLHAGQSVNLGFLRDAPSSTQRWTVHLDSSSSFAWLQCAGRPGLVLSVSAEGEKVCLLPAERPLAPHQQWTLSATGTIACVAVPDKVLTLAPQDSGSSPATLAPLADAFTDAGRLQRWSIRPAPSKRPSTPGRHKDASIWPVLPSGAWNDEAAWPVTGALVVGLAPVIEERLVAPLPHVAPDVFVTVLECGVTDMRRAISVRIPPKRGAPPTVSDDVRLGLVWVPGQGLPEALQMTRFLDECTRVLHLPRSARELYTAQGLAIQELGKLKRDDLVYVSMGDSFDYEANKKRVLAEQISQELEVLQLFYARAYQCGTLALGASGDLVCVQAVPEAWTLTEARQLCTGAGLALAARTLAAGSEIVLEAADENAVQQKWIVDDKGYIQSAMNAGLVLTVKDCGTAGTPIVLSTRMQACNAHQRWRADPVGDALIFRAFAATAQEIALTAAEFCGICSYAVTGGAAVAQLAYASDMRADTHALVCAVCSHSTSSGIESIGVKSFVCSAALADRAGFMGKDSAGPYNRAARLGARVAIGSEAECAKVIAWWTREEKRLRMKPTLIATAPTASLDSTRPKRVQIFRNGVTDPAESVVVLIPDAPDAATQMERFLFVATGNLNLPRAARAVFTRSGKLLASVAPGQADFAPDTEGNLPPLWVSSGEPFMDGSLAGTIKERKEEYQAVKKSLRSLCERLSLASLSDEPANVSPADQALYEQFKAARTRLGELKQELDTMHGSTALDDSSRLLRARPSARVLVRPNGATAGSWRVCWGASLAELLDTCSQNLAMPVRRLYTTHGTLLAAIDGLDVDQKLYASSGEAFIDTRARRRSRYG